MMEILNFIFKDWLHFVGSIIILAIICDSLKGIINIEIHKHYDKENEKDIL